MPSIAPPIHDLSRYPDALHGRRILLCTESFGPVNGVSRTTLMLVNHLRSHGSFVAVVAPHNHACDNAFTPADTDAATYASPKQSQSSGQFDIRLNGYPVPFNPELSLTSPVRLSTLLARTWGIDHPPDLIYLASPASLGFQVMLQLRQQPPDRQIPIICNFQTYLSGYCDLLFPWPLSRLTAAVFDAVQSYLFRHPSVRIIFYPSSFVRRYLDAQRVPGSKMELLGRGVNTDLFNPSKRSDSLRAAILSPIRPTPLNDGPFTGAALPADDSGLVLVTVSRLAGEKGFDFLAQVARELDARRLRFTLYIVGGNRNGEVEREVRGLFDAALRDRGTVRFAGFRVHDELAAAYASADIFLHCSISETFGLVVLESMASGVPVVARDMGGPSDTVAHGHTGFLVPPDDLHAFVEYVLLLAADRRLRCRMADNARRAACAATWTRVNNKVAWRMADTIAERATTATAAVPERQPLLPTVTTPPPPLLGWLVLSKALREAAHTRLLDARLAGILAVILACWTVTGIYMLLTALALCVRDRLLASCERAATPAPPAPAVHI